jgi:hypothetical protein
VREIGRGRLFYSRDAIECRKERKNERKKEREEKGAGSGSDTNGVTNAKVQHCSSFSHTKVSLLRIAIVRVRDHRCTV